MLGVGTVELSRADATARAVWTRGSIQYGHAAAASCPAWVLPAPVPISVLTGLCYTSSAKGVKVTWGGLMNFIAVQVLVKPGEFHQGEPGIHHISSSACSSRAGIASAGTATRKEGQSWRRWLEAAPGGLQTKRAGLLLALDQLSSGFAQSSPANIQG